MIRICALVCHLIVAIVCTDVSFAQSIRAGVAKVDITKVEAGPVNDPLFAKALVIADDSKTIVLVSVDAVAIGEIGYIKNDYLPTVRNQLASELGIPANHLVVNASHCHGIVCDDVAERTLEAIRKAKSNLVPVKIGTGIGTEDRIMENRRLRMKDGREIDVRHAYCSLRMIKLQVSVRWIRRSEWFESIEWMEVRLRFSISSLAIRFKVQRVEAIRRISRAPLRV